MLLSNKNSLARLLLVATAAVAAPGLAVPASASAPKAFSATLSSAAEGFRDIAECEAALRGSRTGKVGASKLSIQRGSLFNRTQGNISRCEIVQGEPLIVVYPRGYVGAIAP